jgi:hypothetical protein
MAMLAAAMIGNSSPLLGSVSDVGVGVGVVVDDVVEGA